MITCRYCGTSYATFQPSCQKCGGALVLPEAQAAEQPREGIAVPPPAPRQVPGNYAWRILGSDGWAITGGVLLFVGAVFGVVGIGLTLGIITAFVGLPFSGLAVLMLGAGGGLAVWRYREAQQTVALLRGGRSVLGEMMGVYQNLNVRVNGRHPWTAEYRYVVDGRPYEGKVVSLVRPDPRQQAGKGVYVLYQPDEPGRSTIYPHPYGNHGG